MVATTDAPNRCCQSTVYCPMNESSRTVSGVALLLVVRVSAAMNSFQAAMNVKISAVTRPGDGQREGDPEQRAEPAAAVHHRGLLELHRDRGEVGVHDPDREGHVEPGVDQDQRPHRVDQVEAEELLVDADDQRGRLQHLGDQHEQQERARGRGTGAAPCSRPRACATRSTSRVAPPATSRLTRRLDADAEARAPHVGEVRPGEVVRQVVAVQQFAAAAAAR